MQSEYASLRISSNVDSIIQSIIDEQRISRASFLGEAVVSNIDKIKELSNKSTTWDQCDIDAQTHNIHLHEDLDVYVKIRISSDIMKEMNKHAECTDQSISVIIRICILKALSDSTSSLNDDQAVEVRKAWNYTKKQLLLHGSVEPSDIDKANRQISRMTYDSDADGHLYLLKCKHGEDTHYYVGSVNRLYSQRQDDALYHRIVRHISNGGDFVMYIEDGFMRKYIADEFDWNIELVAVHDVYKNEETTKIEFKNRLKGLEWKKHSECTIRLDGNVYGGR